MGVLTKLQNWSPKTGLSLLISLQTRSLMLRISFQLIKLFGGSISQGEEEWVVKPFALTTFYHLISSLPDCTVNYPCWLLVYTRIILFQVSNYRLICIVTEAGFDDF